MQEVPLDWDLWLVMVLLLLLCVMLGKRVDLQAERIQELDLNLLNLDVRFRQYLDSPPKQKDDVPGM